MNEDQMLDYIVEMVNSTLQAEWAECFKTFHFDRELKYMKENGKQAWLDRLHELSEAAKKRYEKEEC